MHVRGFFSSRNSNESSPINQPPTQPPCAQWPPGVRQLTGVRGIGQKKAHGMPGPQPQRLCFLLEPQSRAPASASSLYHTLSRPSIQPHAFPDHPQLMNPSPELCSHSKLTSSCLLMPPLGYTTHFQPNMAKQDSAIPPSTCQMVHMAA